MGEPAGEVNSKPSPRPRFAIEAQPGHHPPMLKAVLRWVLILGSLFAVGPLAAVLVDRLKDVDGGHAVTLLVNGNVGAGIAAGAVLFAAALMVGFIGSHFFSLNTGMAAAGLVLVWARFSEGTGGGGAQAVAGIEDIVRRAG